MCTEHPHASYYLHNHRLHLLLLDRMFLSYLFTMLLYTDNWIPSAGFGQAHSVCSLSCWPDTAAAFLASAAFRAYLLTVIFYCSSIATRTVSFCSPSDL